MKTTRSVLALALLLCGTAGVCAGSWAALCLVPSLILIDRTYLED
jgi:hypothetical protein